MEGRESLNTLIRAIWLLALWLTLSLVVLVGETLQPPSGASGGVKDEDDPYIHHKKQKTSSIRHSQNDLVTSTIKNNRRGAPSYPLKSLSVLLTPPVTHL